MNIDFEKLSKYSFNVFTKGILNDTLENDLKMKFENLLKYIEFGNKDYFYMSDFTYNVVDYVKSSIIDEEFLQKSIKDRIEKQKYSSILKEIYKYKLRARFDLNYSFSQYVQDFLNIIENNKDNITKILDSDEFLSCIQILKEADNEDVEKYHDFAKDILYKYLDIDFSKFDEHKNSSEKQKLENIKNFDTSLKEYYDIFLNSIKNEKISSLEGVTELMLKPTRKNSLGEEPLLLAKVSEDDLEKYFYKSMTFVDDSLTFLDDSISKHENFKIFRNKLLNVMKKIASEGNQDQQIKIDRILKDL